MKLLTVLNSILLFLILNVAIVSAYNRKILTIDGDFNTPYPNAVGRAVELIYSFDLPQSFNSLLTKIRVTLKTANTTTIEFPLLATIMQTNEATPLTLPFIIKSSNSDTVRYLEASRTLCIHAYHIDLDERHFEIRIATSSASPVVFELEVLKEDIMQIQLYDPVTINISPTTPDFFYFEFPETFKEMHVKVTVTSPYKRCSVLSIQPALCPVPDHAEDVRVAGSQVEAATGWEWETLETKGAIVTSNKLISTPGFFIALLVTKDDRQCGDLLERLQKESINSTTTLTMIVELDQLFDIEDFFWTLPVYFPVLLNFGILLICGVVCVIIQQCCTRKINLKRSQPFERFQDVSLSDFNKNFGEKKKSIPSTYFGKMIIVIAMFFAIPVFELTSYNLTVLHITGDNDICYYNSFCAHPFGYLKDFNHLWSNMGYIIFGVGFVCITYLKKKCTKNYVPESIHKPTSEYVVEEKIMLSSEGIECKTGIEFKSGLYYAMGLALVMEGVMSAAYHICPNRSNFQYDTCFMFMIAAMCILKIFDFRHPRNLGPNGIFTILALFSLVSATGIMLERYQLNYLLRIFKICFMIVHLYFIGFFTVYNLYVGYPVTVNKFSNDVILSSRKNIPRFIFIFPCICKWKMLELRWHRLISVITFWFVNLLLTVYIWFLDFATLLLYFLIANLIYYVLHYVLIKLLVHREFTLNCRSLQPLVYLVLTCVVSFVAVLYFKINLTEWRKSAADSREGNDKCTLWNFYDDHDIWHMYSAVAILFLYMTLLTMDDGVQDIPQSELKLI